MVQPSKSPIALEDRAVERGRLYSPSAARNRDAIAEVLARVLPTGASVLEIGSGTGEHAVAACQVRPDLSWQPSDPDAASRDSQAAWAGEVGGAILAPLEIDLLKKKTLVAIDGFDALVCMNVIHIAPWAVAEALASLAQDRLRPGGHVVLYGPYLLGDETAPSNLAFDASLKSRNPEWGVRPLDAVRALLASHGLVLVERVDMPANNLMLIFQRREPE